MKNNVYMNKMIAYLKIIHKKEKFQTFKENIATLKTYQIQKMK